MQCHWDDDCGIVRVSGFHSQSTGVVTFCQTSCVISHSNIGNAICSNSALGWVLTQPWDVDAGNLTFQAESELSMFVGSKYVPNLAIQYHNPKAPPGVD